MCVRDHFIGDPNKPEYLDPDEIEQDEIGYLSDEDIFIFDPEENAQFIFGDLDIDDEDDPNYDPADEYGDFLSDSEIESTVYEESDAETNAESSGENESKEE